MDRKKKILIIEDDVDLREILVEKLKLSGLEISEASNGEEGIKKAFEIHPDLIVLDIVMPKIDGISVLRKIREDGWGAQVSVVILTNINENEKLAEALEIGIDEYLIKAEWKLETVIEKIKNITGI